MSRYLLMRLQGPMMSFGAPAIDNIGPAGTWPTRSQLTGTLGCAIGFQREHVDDLFRLQQRLQYAVRCDKQPVRLVDLQTTMTYAEDMRDAVVTPCGAVSRDAQWLRGDAVMRFREYLTDASFVVAIGLRSENEFPTVDDLKHALDFPKGVVTLGRRTCIPSTRLAIGVVEANNLLAALATVKVTFKEDNEGDVRSAIWPENEGSTLRSRVVEVVEDRDWNNGIHTGRRRMREGKVQVQL